MPDKHLYEYATIRILPRVEREEFLNVGIILFSKKEKFLRVLFHLDESRLRCLCSEFDLNEIQQNLESFQKICEGAKDGGPIAQLDIPSRFRWLTAVRSSVIQTSRPHPGMCSNLEETLQRLFTDLVL